MADQYEAEAVNEMGDNPGLLAQQPGSSMSFKEYVWVVEAGCYEERYVAGVYWTAEQAIAAHPCPEREVHSDSPGVIERPGGWQFDKDSQCWENGFDWDDRVRVTRYELLGDDDD